MGVCLSCVAMDAACCAANGVINCCCCVLPWRRSTAARAFYAFMFLLAIVVAIVFRARGQEFTSLQTAECDGLCWSYVAVNRISLSLVIYHSLLMVLMLGVGQGDPRVWVQNAFWPLKFLALVGTMVGSFFIPAANFLEYWIAALVFSAVFILIQSMWLVDWAHYLAETWLEKFENGQSVYKFFLVASAFTFYTAFLSLTIIDYTVLTAQSSGSSTGCKLNNFLISFNLILVIIMTVTSLLKRVREANPRSGILQSGLIGAYITYLVTSAVSEDPYQCRSSSSGLPQNLVTAMQVIGVILTVIAIIYQAWSTGNNRPPFLEGTAPPSEDPDEEDGPCYSYSWFHFCFVLAAFYAASVLNNWRSLDSAQDVDGNQVLAINAGKSAFWVRAATSWGIAVLYIWTLIGMLSNFWLSKAGTHLSHRTSAPIMFPDRDFSSSAKS